VAHKTRVCARTLWRARASKYADPGYQLNDAHSKGQHESANTLHMRDSLPACALCSNDGPAPRLTLIDVLIPRALPLLSQTHTQLSTPFCCALRHFLPGVTPPRWAPHCMTCLHASSTQHSTKPFTTGHAAIPTQLYTSACEVASVLWLSCTSEQRTEARRGARHQQRQRQRETTWMRMQHGSVFGCAHASLSQCISFRVVVACAVNVHSCQPWRR
jgi:hypothetical protein